VGGWVGGCVVAWVEFRCLFQQQARVRLNEVTTASSCSCLVEAAAHTQTHFKPLHSPALLSPACRTRHWHCQYLGHCLVIAFKPRQLSAVASFATHRHDRPHREFCAGPCSAIQHVVIHQAHHMRYSLVRSKQRCCGMLHQVC
jgi:hypothetical protein